MPKVRDGLIEKIPEFIWDIGGGRGRGETYDRMIDRAARKTGISFSRLWAYWYRRVRKPLAEEYIVLKHWAALKADADTNKLMADLDRSQKEVANARSNIVMGTDSGKLDCQGGLVFSSHVFRAEA